MQVTTAPKGLAGAARPRCLGPLPCSSTRSTCSPISRCGRCISMWPGLAAKSVAKSLAAEFVVRVSPLLHPGHPRAVRRTATAANANRTAGQARDAGAAPGRDSATFIPLPHETALPARPADIVLGDPTGAHEIETLAREVGTSARTLSRLFSSGDAIELQDLVPARPHCPRDRKAVDGRQRLSRSNSPPTSVMPASPAFSHAFRQVTGKDADRVRRRHRRAAAMPSFAQGRAATNPFRPLRPGHDRLYLRRGMTYFRTIHALDYDRRRPKSDVRFGINRIRL